MLHATAASAAGHHHRTPKKTTSSVQASFSNARKQQARTGSMTSQQAGGHFIAAHSPGIVPTSEALHKEVLKSGHVEVLRADATWASRIMTLSRENLSFSETNDDPTDSLGHRIVNYIPLHEVTGVRFLEILNLTMDSFKGAPSSPSNPGSEGRLNVTLKKQESFKRTSSPSSPLQPGSPLTWMSSIQPKSAALKLSKSFRGGARNAAHHPHHVQPGDNSFEITTMDDGHNGGRAFTVKCEDHEEWIAVIRTSSKAAFAREHYKTRVQKLQIRARNLYQAPMFQCFVSLVVVLNFAMDAAQAEYEPEAIADSRLASPIYETVDSVSIGVFLLEVLLNMFGNWFWDFFTDGWSLFDLFIIILSVLSTILSDIASLSLLRVFRAVRVLRLLKRFESLRRIVQAIRESIFPVLSALVLVVLVTSIFTIVGVYLFAEQSPSDFGTFSLSICTLFAVMAFGSWPSDTVPAVRYDAATDSHT
eukprot:1808396-Rhodomonas_salina.1